MNAESTGARSTLLADGRCFRVHCEAAETGDFRLTTDSLAVTVGQQIRRRGRLEVWDSVSIHAEKMADDTLEVAILVFNPDWEEPVRIALIRSAPTDAKRHTPLEYSFDHRRL